MRQVFNMFGLKFIGLSLSVLISQALAINVILFAKGPKMPKEVTKEWAIPAHSCDKPEKKIVEKMGSWSKNKYTAQMGTGQNGRVVVKPTKEPDTEAAAIQMLGDMESILAKNTKKGWCEKLVDKFKGGKKDTKKAKRKRMAMRKRAGRARREGKARRGYRAKRGSKGY
ncbi:unnamed protein product [Clonostachys rosea f. rosea IK726]|uniref:Uncharacterized protein n=1 Tax=Clonostachys rosea f. rosea IK726 TaxID=1349383 RepID=A0ACA9UBS0_BIOOC|nr:unnamed protein product [Clonostachys rosea f. rosea IK726]